MTAEIAILNKSAVSLAADSAVTASHWGKVYNSANKLFCLNSIDPVGLMIYGNAELNGIPWETLIKIFRSQERRRHQTLEEYANAFIEFLKPPLAELLDSRGQEQCVYNKVHSALRTAFQSSARTVEKMLAQGTQPNIAAIAEHHLRELLEKLTKLPKFLTPDATWKSSLLAKYAAPIAAAEKEAFENVPLPAAARPILDEIAVQAIVSRSFVDLSGIVVAGFGVKDIFPSLVSFDVGGVINDTFLFRQDKKINISLSDQARIMPFAQTDGVDSFVYGIAPEFKKALGGFLKKAISDYPAAVKALIEGRAGSSPPYIDQVVADVDALSQGMLKQLTDSVAHFQNESFYNPILRTLAMLPKDELGAIAESLVYVTALRRKMSLGIETVGGPIDVAVISKGDGFVWIKRKHYFTQELNPQFMVRYGKMAIEEAEENA